ncbi:tetratricopeptide repeat protein [Streptomyces sp. TRM68367]|uniref:tetratricopeptide repeat protein n=1 Tax=Streptomyces sp. TRM68367 TaxID=2758415 RepID=UPI00165C7703|nr:sel1 repeat family protein [Streptomyces sp. TRM68367]MBC9728453.1 sel1 repeat family protein [Streptomyces sp. TRM68367]
MNPDEELAKGIRQNVHTEDSGVAFVQGAGNQHNHVTQNYFSTDSSLPNDPETWYRQGEMKLQALEYAEAELFLLAAAEAGHVEAMKRLAGIYSLTARGKSAHWYLKLAELGDVDAYTSLGGLVKYRLSLANSPSERVPLVDEAIGWYRKALDAGDEEAAIEIGLILYKESRYEEAIPYLETAAELIKRDPDLDDEYFVDSKLKRARKAQERQHRKAERQEEDGTRRRWWRGS